MVINGWHRSGFILPIFAAGCLFCGCQTNTQALRDSGTASLSTVKGSDTTRLAALMADDAPQIVTANQVNSNADSGLSLLTRLSSTTSSESAWSNVTGQKSSTPRIVLPRNDSAAENRAIDPPTDAGSPQDF
jgi:hypothetical protein